jgi:hypothetical protein
MTDCFGVYNRLFTIAQSKNPGERNFRGHGRLIRSGLSDTWCTLSDAVQEMHEKSTDAEIIHGTVLTSSSIRINQAISRVKHA